MIQLTDHKWQLETDKGFVLKSDITAHSISEAKDYANRYISSFGSWSYDIVTLKLDDCPKVPQK